MTYSFEKRDISPSAKDLCHFPDYKISTKEQGQIRTVAKDQTVLDREGVNVPKLCESFMLAFIP